MEKRSMFVGMDVHKESIEISAAEESRQQMIATKLAIAGHHAGLHDHCSLEGMFAKRGLRIPESIPALVRLLEAELGPLPPAPLPPACALSRQAGRVLWGGRIKNT